MARLKLAVKASTLLEVIVAMVIILIVFSLAMGIYINVVGSTGAVKKQQLNASMMHVIQKSIIEKNWNDEETDEQGVQLRKVVTDYEGFPDLITITVTASEHNRQLGKLRQIVKRTNDVH